VLPGIIRTQLASDDGPDVSWLARLTATGEERDPADMAPVFHFLASDAGAMLQGSVVAADDGCTAGLSASVLVRLVGE
jgi:NAD(P)-dependent dehydrogenase (short-subunit alcohol dehydrogenase family)